MIKPMFRKANIGKMRLKNRIIMAPMGDYLHEVGQGISEQQVHYFVERARGGAGLLVQTVYASNVFDHSLTRFDSEDKVFRCNYLTQAVHSYGAKMAVMLSLGHGRLFRKENGEPPFSPSPYQVWDTEGMMSVPFTTEQVYSVIKDFRYAASIAYRGGYDAIFIQGYGGYLIDQFMTEKWNSRTDEFGGSFENRMRFPSLLIQAIKEVAGDDYPIVFKMTPDHLIQGGRDMEEGIKVAKFLEEAGVSAIQVDVGCIDRWYMQIEPIYYQERVLQFTYAGKLKKEVNIPVFTQGKIRDPEEAAAVLREGLTDFVALGRTLLADPYWPNKVKESHIEDIRPCISCLEGCIKRIDARKTISCAVNPICGFENVLKVKTAEEKKKVIVVGAGPAGMEAALRCAQRGHNVELWEKKISIGGLMRPAGMPSFKKDLRKLVDYYKSQIDKTSNIRLRINTDATAETLLEEKPDAVILAVGGKPIVPKIKGVDGDNVYMATDMLMNSVCPGNKIIVVGGGYVGCETALHLETEGRKVILLEMMDEILPGASRTEINSMMLLDMLEESNIEIRTGAKLLKIESDHLIIEFSSKKERIECDSVVLALGFKPYMDMEKAIEDAIEVYSAGDMIAPRKVIDAVWEGFSAAMSI